MVITPPSTTFLDNLAKHGIKPFFPIETLVYKYVSLESALKIIENASLKYSTPLEFNDPFEMTNSLIDKKYNKDDLRTWLKEIPDLSNNKQKKILKDYYKKPEEITKAFNQSFDYFRSTTGICCFSKSPKKTLMWSHYANNHSGVCLGFNISPFTDEDFFLLLVNYMDKIVPKNYFRDKESVLFYWMITKSKIWEYEEEVRAVYTQKNGLIPFVKPSLKEIYFGLRMSEMNKKMLINLLTELGYKLDKFSTMIMDPTTFDLQEKKLS